MDKTQKALTGQDAATKWQRTADSIVSTIDDTGHTLERLALACQISIVQANRHLPELLEAGRIHRARVSNKFLCLPARGTTFVYFRTQQGANQLLQDSVRFLQETRRAYDVARNEQRKEARAANPKRRGPKKRHANQKPLTVVGGLSKRKPTQKQADTAQMLARMRSQESANYRPKGDNTPAIPPPGKSIKQLPGFTGRTRYSVDGPVTGPFSSLPPGKYAFEPVSAAARAAA